MGVRVERRLGDGSGGTAFELRRRGAVVVIGIWGIGEGIGPRGGANGGSCRGWHNWSVNVGAVVQGAEGADAR